MTTQTHNAHQFTNARRGTMLVVALGVLAIISIAAVSYVTIARVERNSAAAVAREVNYRQQVDALASEVGLVIGADLFGGKVVTRTTPIYGQRDARVHPRMFEDGEFHDAPSSDFLSMRNREVLGPADSEVYATGVGDDPWLASTEPLWSDAQNRWAQVTNLRSTYRFDDDALRWERLDGRYLDLGEFFEDAINGRGNAGAQLDIIDPVMALESVPFGTQMAALEPPFDQLTPRDERLFADTDGDLRPDARWQTVDRLGNLYGLVWVQATRIMDASALVNYNTSIEFGDELAPGDGQTPADVDLYRLLRNSQTPEHSDVNIGRLAQTFQGHLEDVFNIPELFEDIRDTSTFPRLETGESLNTYLPWDPFTPGRRLTQNQREFFYRYAGGIPYDAVSNTSGSYPLRDLIDLQGFWGTNNSLVLSEFEKIIDGPEAGGFLPPAGGDPDVGPLRSREEALDKRVFSQSNPEPSPQAIFEDNRHHLTPVSGAADFSPVPAINYKDPASAAIQFNRKVRLHGFDRNDLDDAYNAFVWALAPFATDLSLGGALRSADMSQGDANYHYGGGNNGASLALSSISGIPVQASFAINTAVALTVNLLDATDGPEDSNLNDGPTILRAFTNYDHIAAGTQPVFDNGFTPEIEFGPRLTHGDIDPALLPIQHSGDQLTTAEAVELATRVDADAVNYGNTLRKGVTHVGLDRQPFLKEVTTIGVYSDAGTEGGNENYIIELASEPLGTIIAFELANPWGVQINTDNYVIVLPDSPSAIGAGSQIFVLPSATILPGGNHVFYFAWDSSSSPAWGTEMRDQIRTHVETLMPASSILTPINARRAPDGSAIPNVNPAPHDLFKTNTPVLVMYENVYTDPMSATTSYQHYLVDRMTPTTAQAASVQTPDTIDISNFDQWNNIGAPLFGDYAYFVNLGYDENHIRFVESGAGQRRIDGLITGRAMVTQTMQRSDVQPFAGGFPSWILEPDASTREGNRVSTPVIDGQAWLDPDIYALAFPSPPFAADPTTPFNGSLLADEIMNFPGNRFDLGNTKTLSMMELSSLPSWQFFVPNRDLIAPTELHMLCAFTHTCLNHDLTNLDAWTTIGEKLADERWYDLVNKAGQTNPYIGVLDPSRYIYGNNGMANIPADSPSNLYLPLATRVIDCFEGLNYLGQRAEGRININTASENVLALLPFVEPDFTINTGMGGQIPQYAPSATDPARVLRMLEYRDLPRNRTAYLGAPMQGVRADSRDGFASLGELAILGQWDVDGRVTNQASMRGFLELADGGNDPGYPIERHVDYAAGTYNPVDDPEERLAIARAVSNIASTRSDVYIAWFLLRGYDPDTIESIPVSGDPLDSLNHEDFKPEYESRWLAVYDRSNMTGPLDRPELLLLIELPLTY